MAYLGRYGGVVQSESGVGGGGGAERERTAPERYSPKGYAFHKPNFNTLPVY